jgi:Na+/H+-dicarboxylate symporter
MLVFTNIINMSLWKKVLLGLFLGIILGFVLKEQVIYLKPFGDIFIRLVKMIIVPMIFFAIVSGITSIQDSKMLGRVGVKASLTYIATTLFAVIIGLLVGNIIKPGLGIILDFTQDASSSLLAAEATNVVRSMETILNTIIPDNAIGAMAQGTILHVVFFAIFTGITVNTLDQESIKKFRDVFQVFSKMFFKMVYFITKLSPLAACFLTAWVIGIQGIKVISNLLKLIISAYVAFGIQYIVFGIIISFWTKLSPIQFFKKSLGYQLIAFSTSSSKAALPVAIKVCKEKLGISEISSSFVLPLGASINMDGIAIYGGLCAIFFAQATGRILGFSDYGLIMLASTLGSIGGAGIPSGTIFMLPMILGSVGLPIEGVALIVGIDRIIDMMRTVISITGDACVALCIDHSEGFLNKQQYYNK